MEIEIAALSEILRAAQGGARRWRIQFCRTTINEGLELLDNATVHDD
jgi:hypothetical protein